MNSKMTFCAHRGVSALMPENTVPAFAAALALGAEEIEFDVRLTGDGKTVISHDPDLMRVCGESGRVGERTLEELLKMNVGGKHGWVIPFSTPKQVFEQLAGQICFNIHLKEVGENGCLVREIVELTERYRARESVYLAADQNVIGDVKRYANGLSLCAIQLPKDKRPIFDVAVEHECDRVQFWHGMFDRALIERFHAAGMRCNVFFADTEEGYAEYLDMEMDTILTNRMDLASIWRKK